MQWEQIVKVIETAKKVGNANVQPFVRLNLADNTIVLRLTDPYAHLDEHSDAEDEHKAEQLEDEEEAEEEIEGVELEPTKKRGKKKKNKKKQQQQEKNAPPSKQKGFDIEIDLDLTADQNCRKYFTDRKSAASKQQRTLQSSAVALKNAQRQIETKVKEV